MEKQHLNLDNEGFVEITAEGKVVVISSVDLKTIIVTHFQNHTDAISRQPVFSEGLRPYIDVCIMEQELAYQRALADPSKIGDEIDLCEIAKLSADRRGPSEEQSKLLQDNIDRIKSLLMNPSDIKICDEISYFSSMTTRRLWVKFNTPEAAKKHLGISCVSGTLVRQNCSQEHRLDT